MAGPEARPSPARGGGRFFARYALILAVLATLVALASCGGAAPTTEKRPAEATRQQASSEYPLTVRDSLGREVKIEEEPERIVSMAPSITETLFAVGAGDRVVGVTSVDDYPPEAKKIAVAGDFNGPNVEKVLALKTDLLMLSFDTTTKEQAEKLEKQTGADVFVMNPQSVRGTIRSIGTVAEAVGEAKQGREVQGEMRDELKAVEKAVAGEPRPTVFYELYGDPLQTVGPGSIIGDEIRLAGGRNVAADARTAYPTYSEEVLFKKNPDYYLVDSTSSTSVGKVTKRSGYGALEAVKEGHVEVMNADLTSRPGPRITDGVREIAEAIHPKAFGE